MPPKRATSASPALNNTLKDFFSRPPATTSKTTPSPRARKSSIRPNAVIKRTSSSGRNHTIGNGIGESDDTPVVISSDEDDDEITVLSDSPPHDSKALTSNGLLGPSTRSETPNKPSRTLMRKYSVTSELPLSFKKPFDPPTPVRDLAPPSLPTAGFSAPFASKNEVEDDSQDHKKLSQALEAEEDDWDEGNEEGYGMEDPKDEDQEGEFGDDEGPEDDDDHSKGKRKGICLGSLPLPGKKRKVEDAVEVIDFEDGGPSSKKAGNCKKPISSFLPTSESFDDAEPEENGSNNKALKGPNAFSVLMSGHKETAEWKVVESDLKRDGKRQIGRRKAPFYKVMTGMPIAVDAFRYGNIPKIKAYFLTHAHSDHYTNLSSSWKHGPIYCSVTTANLIKLMLGVEARWVHGLPWDTPYELPHTGGVTVTVLHANHCPGSSLFLFEGRQTVNAGDSIGFKSPYIGGKRIWRYLHCGDFRACPQMVLHPAIAGKKIDTCYLDTTYLNPKYCFPPQPLVIDACATLARRSLFGRHLPAITEAGGGHAQKDGQLKPRAPEEELKPDAKREEEDVKSYLQGLEGLDMDETGRKWMDSWLVKNEEEVKEEVDAIQTKKTGRTLILMGTYSIGKERIVKGVARAIGSKVYCDARKRGILMCEADEELHAMLTSDPVEASIHLVPLQMIQLDRLEPYLHKLRDHFDRIIAFRPTGWTYSPPAGTESMPDINHVIRRDQNRTFTAEYLRPMRGSCRQFMMFGVPYSEHSSFFELTCFALSVPGPEVKMIATVNVGNEKSRGKMKRWFEKWQAEKLKRMKAGLPAVVDYRDVTYW